jgi:hypothetical protein
VRIERITQIPDQPLRHLAIEGNLRIPQRIIRVEQPTPLFVETVGDVPHHILAQARRQRDTSAPERRSQRLGAFHAVPLRRTDDPQQVITCGDCITLTDAQPQALYADRRRCKRTPHRIIDPPGPKGDHASPSQDVRMQHASILRSIHRCRDRHIRRHHRTILLRNTGESQTVTSLLIDAQQGRKVIIYLCWQQTTEADDEHLADAPRIGSLLQQFEEA